jgi:RNA polymerase sigma-70 factor (ECF subfamily)
MYRDAWRVLWCAAVSVVRDRTLAQDVVQQAAVVGLERLDDFEPNTNFISWMVRIVKNIGLNEARKSHRRRTSPTDAVELDAATRSRGEEAEPVLTGRGLVVADRDAFDDDVLHALDDLDDTARGCLLLRAVLDMTYRDIALALDIPEGTAASHVHRARKAMRDRLRPRHAAAAVPQGGQP